MKPKLVVIAQARMDSARLPGKVLMMAAGEPMLAHVMRRAKAIPGADEVCCATSDRSIDDRIADVAADCGVTVFRGSAEDVLSRYAGAAALANADVVMRITCDCPLLDPQVCADVASLRDTSGADYASNVAPPSFPHGLDCEVFTRASLAAALVEATDAFDREHVTPWIRRHKTMRQVNLRGPGLPVAEQRWTLDYPEDYELIRRILEAFPASKPIPLWPEIAAYVADRPELNALNASRRSPARFQVDADGVQRTT